MSQWWRNAWTDHETAEIDRILTRPPDELARRVRQLITRFEACHHKAGRHLELILDNIGTGAVDNPATRDPSVAALARQNWQTACDLLRAWLVGPPHPLPDVHVGPVAAEELLQALGECTPIKSWQVRRVVERIDSFLHPHHPYADLSDESPAGPWATCDPQSAHFLTHTRHTILHDTADGHPHEMSLAAAIDMLMPCHWNFPGNLLLVLRAIAGEHYCREPFAACGHNIRLSPILPRVQAVVASLDAFTHRAAGLADPQILARLGPLTPQKSWLAASLAKTLRIQLHL